MCLHSIRTYVCYVASVELCFADKLLTFVRMLLQSYVCTVCTYVCAYMRRFVCTAKHTYVRTYVAAG